MSRYLLRRNAIGALLVMFIATPTADAQARFELLTRDTVAESQANTR
jgi:hypothetical protein